MADVIAIVADVIATTLQIGLNCNGSWCYATIYNWLADVIARVADVIATYFIVCWLVLLPWW